MKLPFFFFYTASSLKLLSFFFPLFTLYSKIWDCCLLSTWVQLMCNWIGLAILSVAVSVRVQVWQQLWANLQGHESRQQNQTLLRSDVCGESDEINESIWCVYHFCDVVLIEQRIIVFQDENRISEMMWKKMRDDNCGATEHSIRAGSLAGMRHSCKKWENLLQELEASNVLFLDSCVWIFQRCEL